MIFLIDFALSTSQDLYLSPTGNPRQKAVAISKNLIQLADGATRKETMCLERVVKEWIKSREIDDNVIKVCSVSLIAVCVRMPFGTGRVD